MNIQVYTAITNNHDPMRADIKVFTEWERCGNPILAARYYKTHPHVLFPKADWTIWVDGNVFLNVEPEALVEKCGPASFGVFIHPFRNCIWEEGAAVEKLGLDDAEVVANQLLRYKRLGYLKNAGLANTMLLVRKNSPINKQRNEAWWSEICSGSFRDQISFPTLYPPQLYWQEVLPITSPNEYFTRCP